MLLRIVIGVASVLYPLAIYLGLTYWEPRAVAGLLLVFVVPMAIARLRAADAATRWVVLQAPIGIGVVAIAAWIADEGRLILAMPVIINAILLATFGATLRADVSMIERFARMIEPDLSPPEVVYCRSVTRIWCVFFVFNGAVAGLLAAFAPMAWWALYTGLLSYVLMGLLFAVEYTVRKARFRRYGGGIHDRAFARLWPPRPLDSDG